MKVLKGHIRGVNDLAFSPDGALLVSCGVDRTVRLWDTHGGTGRILVPAQQHSVAWVRVLFCANGRHVLCRSMRQEIQSWDVVTSHRAAVIQADESGTHIEGGLAVSSARGLVVASEWVSSAGKNVLHVWDTRTWKKRMLYRTSDSYTFSGLAFDPTGTRLATRVGVFDVDTRARLVRGDFYGDSLAWSPRAPLVAGAGYDNVLSVKNTRTGALVKELALPEQREHDFAFSPDGRFIAVVSNAASVCVWETQGWTAQRELEWGIGKLKCIAFAPDGLRAACGSQSGRIVIWDWDL